MTSVVLTQDALRDLDDIHGYIASQDGLARADAIIDKIAGVLSKLASFPERGEHPPELTALGMKEFRQVRHKPYRMIYQVQKGKVFVLLIADGRRDMQSLLQRRLLRG